MEEDLNISNNSKPLLKPIPLWTTVIAIILAPLSSYILVLFFTSVMEFMAQEYSEYQSLTISWPPALFIAAIIGGILGSTITILEIRLIQNKKRVFIPAKLLSSDLLYIGSLAFVIYIFEALSESLLLQGLLFVCEIAWFAVLGLNISKLTLEAFLLEKKSKTEEEKT